MTQIIDSGRRFLLHALLLPGLMLLLAGCGTTGPTGEFADLGQKLGSPPAPPADSIVLHEGDSVRITFPGAANLNGVHVIRRDGKITLPLIGEFQAAGVTPAQMQTELLKLYGPQLQTKEVEVAVESAVFPIYVTGAVLRPGRINADRPLTVLEAVLDAGVDYNRANLKAVRVIRHENGRTQNQTLNLKAVLDGKTDQQFKLKPQDIVYVPEKFSWF